MKNFKIPRHGLVAGVASVALVTGVAGTSQAFAAEARPVSIVPSGTGSTNPGGFGDIPTHFTGLQQPNGTVVSRHAHGAEGVYVLTVKVEDNKNEPVASGVVMLISVKTGRGVVHAKSPDSTGRVTFKVNPSARHKLGKVSLKLLYIDQSQSQYKNAGLGHLYFKVVK